MVGDMEDIGLLPGATKLLKQNIYFIISQYKYASRVQYSCGVKGIFPFNMLFQN